MANRPSRRRKLVRANLGSSLTFAAHISLFGIALSALWTPLNTLVLPNLVSNVVSESFRGTAVGTLSFVGVGAAIVLQPLFGAVNDAIRSGERRRWFIIPLGAAMAVCIPFLALLPTFWMLLLLYVVLQFVSNGAQAAYQALVPDLVDENERGRASGVKTAFDVLGTATGLIIVGGMVALNAPNVAVLLAITVVVAAGTLSVWRLVPASPPQKETPAAVRSLVGAFTPLWRSPSPFRRAVLSRFIFLLGLYPVQHFFIYYLQDRFKVQNATSTASVGILVALVIASIAAVVAGSLAGVFGRTLLLRVAVVFAAIGVAGIAFAPTVLFVAPAGVALALGIGAFDATNWSVLTESVPENGGARYLGVANMATAGASAASGLVGPLIDLLRGFAPQVTYPVTFSIAALVVLMALFTLGSEKQQKHA